MKKIIHKVLMFAILAQVAISSTSVAFAQWDDVDYGGFGGGGSGSSYVDYNPYTPVNYNDVDYGGWSNSSTNYTDYSCVGCNESYNSGSSYVDYNPYTPVNYNDVDYGGWSNSSTNYTDYSCVGCDSSYTYPTYTNPTYTNPTYTYPTYTSPTYTYPTYTTPVYTTPTYTYPTYTTPVYTTPIPTTNTVRCSDGQLPHPTTGCNRTTTIPVVNNTVCADGFAPVNGSCIRTNTIPVTNNTVCADGFAPVNGSCTRTNTIPVTTSTVCSDGQLPHPTTGCNRVNVIPTVQYQTCWDGSIIPTTSVCQAQFKVCANGTSIPVNQTCYVAPKPVYVPPTVVKFNNVVTSIVTQITQTSGRCNGIGLIANNAQSTGWFEYGETTNLGRTTAQAQIGSSNTAPFSNVLANLKPATRYYCRAVMQNQYGTVKGEIVGFTTASKVTTYIKPVVTKTVTTKTKVSTTKTNQVTCVDGTTVTVNNQSAATLINDGQKLIALQIEKTDGKISSEQTVKYTINFKNLSDTRLTGVVIRVALPQELRLTSSNVGNYDEASRIITLNQDGIDPYTEGTILITGVVAKDAPIGKTIVTNVYAVYTVPGTQTQDEVTAYVIGSVVPQSQTELSKEDTGVKKVVGVSGVKGFMPSSLIEWLALLAILFIIFILGRSIYASYKEDENRHH